VAVEAKPEVEIWRRPKKINFSTVVFYSFLQTVFSWDVPFRHNTKRHRRQTDRQTDKRHTRAHNPKIRAWFAARKSI